MYFSFRIMYFIFFHNHKYHPHSHSFLPHRHSLPKRNSTTNVKPISTMATIPLKRMSMMTTTMTREAPGMESTTTCTMLLPMALCRVMLHTILLSMEPMVRLVLTTSISQRIMVDLLGPTTTVRLLLGTAPALLDDKRICLSY